jgi:DivIVA domain-containing protein
MVDESFHLTPLDVRRFDFGSALRGYDKARVDQFRDQVAEELERLTRLAQDLESKAKGFHEQLRAFRERDKALNDALVSAQQLRAEIREQAEREGQLILREARSEGDRSVDEARAEVRRLQAEVDALERTRRSHLAQLRAMAQRQLTEIEAAERVAEDAGHTTDEDGRPKTEDRREDRGPKTEDGAPKTEGRTSVRSLTPTWLDASVPE